MPFEMSPRRTLAGQDEGASSSSERYKAAIAAAAEEWVCALTLELPLDPVVAEDGRIYERSAIEEFIRKRGANSVTSPVSREPMGVRLLPSVQIRNAIEHLVRSNAVNGDNAGLWTKRIKEDDEVATLRRRAAEEEACEGGDSSRAMYTLGNFYAHGIKGLPRDAFMAYSLYRRAADRGCVRAAACAGYYLVRGIGVTSDVSRGMDLTRKAVEKESDLAAYFLGKWYCKGMYGLPADPFRGKALLKKVVSGDCKVQHLQVKLKEEAATILRELESSSNRHLQ